MPQDDEGCREGHNRSAAAVKRYAKRSPYAHATEDQFLDMIPDLVTNFSDDDK